MSHYCRGKSLIRESDPMPPSAITLMPGIGGPKGDCSLCGKYVEHPPSEEKAMSEGGDVGD